MKLPTRETHEEVLERLLEGLHELSEERKIEINQAIREIKEGKYRTHEELKKDMSF